MDIPLLGTFAVPRATVAFGTAFTRLIPPFPGTPQTPGTVAKGISRITSLRYTTAATAHLIGVMRPFNYTTFAATAAAGQKVVVVTADPGLYATAANWKYAPFAAAPTIANNAISAGDYVVYQTASGIWAVDTVASGTSPTLTLTANVPTGGVVAGGLLYFFGVIGDSDPNTGLPNPQWTTTANSDAQLGLYSDVEAGLVSALHAGDPMLFYSPNGTATGVLELACGVWSKY